MRARDISSVVATALGAALATIVVSSAVGQGTDPYADPDQVDGQHVAYYQVVHADNEIRDLERATDDGERVEIERQLKEARDKREGLVATIEDYEQRVSVLKGALGVEPPVSGGTAGGYLFRTGASAGGAADLARPLSRM